MRKNRKIRNRKNGYKLEQDPDTFDSDDYPSDDDLSQPNDNGPEQLSDWDHSS